MSLVSGHQRTEIGKVCDWCAGPLSACTVACQSPGIVNLPVPAYVPRALVSCSVTSFRPISIAGIASCTEIAAPDTGRLLLSVTCTCVSVGSSWRGLAGVTENEICQCAVFLGNSGL